MKKIVRILAVVLVVAVPFTIFANLQGCFDQFVANVMVCDKTFGPGLSHDTCVQGAAKVLDACLKLAAKQPGALYNAEILSTTFYRAKGKPEIATNTFTIPESGTYYFNLYNGSRTDKSLRVSAATVSILPDKTIFYPNDFNKNVWFVVEPAYLEAGEYTMSVQLKSEPGAFITIIVSDRDFTAANAE